MKDDEFHSLLNYFYKRFLEDHELFHRVFILYSVLQDGKDKGSLLLHSVTYNGEKKYTS